MLPSTLRGEQRSGGNRDRRSTGPFKKIEEVINVRGIGEKSFLKIKDRLTVAAQQK